MQNVARHTTALVKKQEQLGSTMFEFGVAFTLLANVRSPRRITIREGYIDGEMQRVAGGKKQEGGAEEREGVRCLHVRSTLPELRFL